MKSILDKSFRYVPSVETDVAATFRRVRREMREATEQDAARLAEVNANVKALAPRKVKA